jgi:hypothetical protein
MQIKVENNNIDTAQWVKVSPTKARKTQPDSDSTSFYRAEALEQSVRTTPEVRPQAVERARKLVEDVRYPGDETIRGIASLLALKLDGTTQTGE